MIHRIASASVKTAAFARKEVLDVVRQPQLILLLVLGPFLILALFGIGYQHELDPMRALLVIDEEDAALRSQLETRLADFSGSFVLEGTTPDRAGATLRVRDGDVDVAVVAPSDPLATIRSGERATFTLLHDTFDPYERATVGLIAATAIDAVNRELLAELVATGQEESEGLAPLLEATRDTAGRLRSTLESADGNDAEEQRAALAGQLTELASLVAPTEALTAMLADEDHAMSDALGPRLETLRDRIAEADGQSLEGQAEALAEVETELDQVADAVADLQTIPPEVLVSPLDVESHLVGSLSVGVTDFYAPAVIALLIQHLAITFASLSLVKEVRLGTPEVFQVAPLGAGHILSGKFMAYLGGVAFVGAALSGLIFSALGVPLVGSPLDFAVVLCLLTAASLGVGFVVSSFVTSDTQAVNVTMIFLLLSIFFSGFFLAVDRLLPAVQVVSWLLPVTHGIDAIRDVMFRGASIDLRTWLVLGLGAIGTYVLAWALLRARLREH